MPLHVQHPIHHLARASIAHVVVVIQENRSVDNLFNGFCAAATQCMDTVRIDPYTGVKLQPVSLAAPYDLPHWHTTFVDQYKNGAMNGFGNKSCASGYCGSYAYVPASETMLYRKMFSLDGVLDDAVAQANQGPSVPSHQYAIAGHAGGYDSDHEDMASNPNGRNCNNPRARVERVNLTANFPGVETLGALCEDYSTILDEAAAGGLSWRYYVAKKRNLWDAPSLVHHLTNSPNVIEPETTVLRDIAAGQLANVVFVTPNPLNSDHPGAPVRARAGEEWVAQVVDAIGKTSYWTNTVVIVYWDDWGGWYDHIKPIFAPDPFNPNGENPNEYGFRVPYGVISAYARTRTVAHMTCSVSDSLLFIEQTFSLPSLGALDQYQPGCTGAMLNLSASPAAFVPI